MSTKIKFCGLTRARDIEAANRLMPEFIGFVFVPNSKRCVSPDLADVFRRMLDPGISAVGVFMNDEPSFIVELVKAGIIDAVQLHGGEDRNYISKLKAKIDRPVIKSFRIRTPDDIEKVKNCPADYILLDTGADSGKQLDWSMLTDPGRQFILAGGLTPENVGIAIERIRPFGVDVSSGIETGGYKDAAKMTDFAEAVRNADRQAEVSG